MTFTPDTTKSEIERLEAVENALSKLPTADDMDEIVRQALKEVFLQTGKGAKAVIITLAVVIGSIAVIGGGLKSLLGFIGFQYLPK